jgi:hypothetical protein
VDLLIALVLLFCAVVVPIWAVVDAANRPAVAFYGAGSNKTAWIVVLVVSWFIGLGFFLGGSYLLFTRKKLRRQLARGY